MLQEDRHAFRGGVLHDLADAIDEEVPGAGIVALEIVVVALRAGPDDEVRADGGREINAAFEGIDALAAQR